MQDPVSGRLASLILPGGQMPELLGNDLARFRAAENEALRTPVQLALMAGLVVMPLFAALDRFALPESWTDAVLLRGLLQVLPLAAALLWVGRRKVVPTGWLLAGCGLSVNLAICLIVIDSSPDEPGHLAYQFGMLLMPLAAVAVAPVTVSFFLLVVIATLAMVGAVALLVATPVMLAASVLNALLLITVALVGAVVLVGREAQARNDFLQRRLLGQERDAFASANDELTRTRDQLVQAEKLVALGGLLASIAHQINTPVGNAVTGASLLKQRVDELSQRFRNDDLGVDDLQRFLAEGGAAADLVLQGCQRAAGLIEGFKQVAMDAADDDRRIFALRLALEDACARLRGKIEQSNVVVTIDALQGVTVEGYRGLVATAVRYLLEVMITTATHETAQQVAANDPGATSPRDGAEGGRAVRIALRAGIVDHDQVEVVVGAAGRLDREGVPPGGLDSLMMAFPDEGTLGLSLHVLHACVRGPMAGRMEVARHADGLPTVAMLFPRIAPPREL